MIYDTIIIGAGAAGLMCAIHATGDVKRKVLVLEHGKKVGPKILISGGGRCNFTNIDASAGQYLSSNSHFAKSALHRYTPYDFMDLMSKHNIGWNEKKLGQLFCNEGAKRIVAMLIDECEQSGVKIRCETSITAITHNRVEDHFTVQAHNGINNSQDYYTKNLVIATGGKSIPTMGATGFAYDIARQFGLTVTKTRPALVPFTFSDDTHDFMNSLAGVSIDSCVTYEKISFRENILFTHRGLSGPAILQISSFWREGNTITINLLPDVDIPEQLKSARTTHAKTSLKVFLSRYLPSRFVQALIDKYFEDKNMGALSNRDIEAISSILHHWELKPSGTEGYRTAEVTLGGIDTQELSSKTMESKKQKGLYFIGECVDVTGWLGGYNFQWAWASGFAAGEAIRSKT